MAPSRLSKFSLDDDARLRVSSSQVKRAMSNHVSGAVNSIKDTKTRIKDLASRRDKLKREIVQFVQTLIAKLYLGQVDPHKCAALSDSESTSDEDESGDADISENEDGEDDGGDDMEVEADGSTAQESKNDSDDVLNTGRLFVRNLPYTAMETKRTRGITYIFYPTSECAARSDTSHLPKTFKQKREEQRKASEAGGNTKSWNSLFMRSDTVLENIVRVYGVTKSEFLDREAEDPVVRLALAETKVIAQTKEALAKAGVNVASLEKFASGQGDEQNLSKHTLFVKNLPFASTEKELAQMFGKFGSLDKIILPTTKTMALDDDSDMECELEASPVVGVDAVVEATAHVKVRRRYKINTLDMPNPPPNPSTAI
ncbi:unnamed protein product [Cochlearia groenlandica]